jgi:hypothetical protein
MTVLRRLFGVGACVLAASLAASSGLIAQAASATPRITVRPANVMVGSPTTVTGSGFPARAQVPLRECGVRFWIDPEEPCNTANAITVETNGFGHFKTTFHVELCPDAAIGKVVTERTCYIGRVLFGEDTGELQPAARIIVTYP